MRMVVLFAALAAVILPLAPPASYAQEGQGFAAEGIPAVPLPDAPVVYDTAAGQRIRVSVVTDGLTYPWGLAFLPDGRILVTERLGTLRQIRDGVLDPAPIAGVPEVYTEGPLAGLMDEYTGLRVSERPWQEDLEQPEIVWIPSIAPSGLVFYNGDRFPAWRRIRGSPRTASCTSLTPSRPRAARPSRWPGAASRARRCPRSATCSWRMRT